VSLVKKAWKNVKQSSSNGKTKKQKKNKAGKEV
jgi:hypothetical protein